MTGGFTRGLGSVLLVACAWWGLGAMTDVASVSPVHWGLLLPHLALAGFPAMVGLITAGAMLFGRSGVRSLVFALVVALAQAAAISYFSPEISERYSETVNLGKQLQNDSAPGWREEP